MDSNMPAGRVWCFTLLFLSYIIFTTSIVTQDPVLACVGDTITVSCDLTVPNPGDIFVSSITDFIIGNSVPLGDTIVNGNGILGDVDLSRFTADSPIGSTENLLGTLTLLSYTLADNGLTLGCSNDYLVDGDSSNRASLTETINIQQATPPSPVSLSADFDSTTCSGSVELAWTAGASDRPIETYFLYLNGVDIASISSDMNSYSHAITLQIDTDYVYSVLAMSCAGNSTLATADTITIGAPPSSPVVTLYQANTTCSNVNISWTTPFSDRDITEYSVYRDNTLLTTTTVNQYTDTDQLTINTVYEYSVTAISCAGSSTPGVRTISIEAYSFEPTNPPLTLSYNDTTNELSISWSFNTNTLSPSLIEYSLEVTYFYTQLDDTYHLSNTSTFSQISTDTDYTLQITTHEFMSIYGVETNIIVCLRINMNCGMLAGMQSCYFYYSDNPAVATPLPADSPVSLIPAVVVLIAIIIIILILSIAVISAMTIVIVIMYRKIQSLKSSAKPTEPAHLYQYIDMDKLTPVSPAKPEAPYYTPMSPVGTQSNPEYSNLK